MAAMHSCVFGFVESTVKLTRSVASLQDLSTLATVRDRLKLSGPHPMQLRYPRCVMQHRVQRTVENEISNGLHSFAGLTSPWTAKFLLRQQPQKE